MRPYIYKLVAKGVTMGEKTPDKSPFSKLDHVGVVVRDMDKTIEYLSSLGIGPFQASGGAPWVEVPFKGEVRGKPAEWKLKISNARVGEVVIELLQPSEGENALKDFLESNGEGIHHIGFAVEDINKELTNLAQQGVKVLMSAKGPRGGGFGYFETNAFGGIITELRQLVT